MVDIIFPSPFGGAMGDHAKKKAGTATCVGCGSEIHDQYILKVSPDLEWHAACLKCADCSQYLDETCTCFVRDGKTYCKRDYIRSMTLDLVAYLAGLSLVKGGGPLGILASGGKEAWTTLLLSADAVPGRQPSLRSHVHKQAEKTTRVRTVLNEKQLHTLRTCYAANPRPDALMKEQLVEMTGLSPRVIRVWFQNKRCKDKKKSILMKQLQQQQHSDKASLQGLTGTPLVAGSPIRHDSAVQGSAVEVQTYQPPWKALSNFALQSDLDQPAFQQLLSISESGSLGNSSGSDVTSLSSQLPDTPNSMVPSPVET
ncbi:insulin gene enhancer protein ISL-2 [Protobothrops mucrosquamatus]|uniref:insulin gene enhancer protein ISL-2 n=1 Tax=Protobothrops mucrosquamatus TaxID=103944 RepID=UPI000775EDF7|nr:insulin gene enhancer protein ISL-2 [Protobothrops mucrosquamatus]